MLLAALLLAGGCKETNKSTGSASEAEVSPQPPVFKTAAIDKNPAAEINLVLQKSKSPVLAAVQYGRSEYAKYYLEEGGSWETEPIGWLFYLIVYPRETGGNLAVLVDTGFEDEAKREQFGIHEYVSPILLLHQLGFQPEDIELVLLTHTHFDHAGLLKEFVNARIVVHPELLEETRDLAAYAENVLSIENSSILPAGITPVPVGGHTAGSTAYILNLGSRKVLLTGDEAYTVDRFRNQIGTGAVRDADANKAFIQSYSGFDGEVLTFHDPQIAPSDSRIRLYWSE